MWQMLGTCLPVLHAASAVYLCDKQVIESPGANDQQLKPWDLQVPLARWQKIPFSTCHLILSIRYNDFIINVHHDTSLCPSGLSEVTTAVDVSMAFSHQLCKSDHRPVTRCSRWPVPSTVVPSHVCRDTPHILILQWCHSKTAFLKHSKNPTPESLSKAKYQSPP